MFKIVIVLCEIEVIKLFIFSVFGVKVLNNVLMISGIIIILSGKCFSVFLIFIVYFQEIIG